MDNKNILTNQLTIIFRDQDCLPLSQHDSILSLSTQHQAAPLEYQILKALEMELMKLKEKTNDIENINNEQTRIMPQQLGWEDDSTNVDLSCYTTNFEL